MDWQLLTQRHAPLAQPDGDAASFFACVDDSQSSTDSVFIPHKRGMQWNSSPTEVLATLSSNMRDAETIPPRKFGASRAGITTLAALGPEVISLSEDFFTHNRKKSAHGQYTRNAAHRQHGVRARSTV